MPDNIEIPPHKIQDKKKERLQRISAGHERPRAHNENYSKFIRRVQITLPIIALILLGVAFGWNNFNHETIDPVRDMPENEQQIGKNELTNPTFESMDEKGQPYSITAKTAIQNEQNENLLHLDEPVGTMDLNDGQIVTIKAKRGVYTQDKRYMELREDVALFHDLGYEMYMDALDIDMLAGTAFSNTDVSGKGPEGTIAAKGLEGSTDTEVLIFKGPAKLVLTLENGSLGLGGLAP